MNKTSNIGNLKRGRYGEFFIPTLAEIFWDNSEKNGKMFTILLNIWHTINNTVLTKVNGTVTSGTLSEFKSQLPNLLVLWLWTGHLT